MILKNENDIYIFFEAIEQLEPGRVLDVGMFLKRIGCVSRKAMNREVPEETQLDGVDFFPETNFPVWDGIYDSVLDVDGFAAKGTPDLYGLAVVLGTEEFYRQKACPFMIQNISQCARYALVSRYSEQWKQAAPFLRSIELQVEQDRYYLLDLGEA